MIREIDIEDFSEATLSAQNQFHVLCDYTRRDIGDGIEEIKWRTRLGGWGINALALTVPVLGSLAVWGVGAMQTATPNWNKVYVTNRNGRWYYLGQSIDEARNESSILAQLREQIRVLESEVVQLRGQIVNLNARVRELEGNLTNLCEELRQVQAQGTRDTARIAELENELREARVQLARTIAQLNEQISRARARATADAAALEQAINENRSNQGVITGLRELQQQSQEALRAANDQIAQLESTHGAEVRELRSRLERAEGRNGGPDWINGASDRQIANELNLGSMKGSYHRGSNTTVDVMNIVNLPYRQYDMVTVEKLLHARLDETKGGELVEKETILPTEVSTISIDKRRNTRIRNSGTTRMMMSSYYDDRDLSNVITNIDTNLADIKNYTDTNILIPLSLEGRHAVGLLMVKQLNTDSTYKAYYLDSENNNIPQGLLEIINEHGYEVEHLPVEQQEYMNCGPEVIENFMLYTYGERFSQEEAIIRDSHIIDESMSKSIINTEIALLDLNERSSVNGKDQLVEDLILEKNIFASVELFSTDACGTSLSSILSSSVNSNNILTLGDEGYCQIEHI